MDYKEMLFPAHVRTMAGEFRKGQYMFEAQALYGDPDKAQKMEAWSEENTMAKFIELAYREILATSKIIASLEKADLEKTMSGKYAPGLAPTSAGTEPPLE